MVAFYVKKILSGAINPKTGAPWTLSDVPARWHNDVAEALENSK